jgi:hypothetical protein
MATQTQNANRNITWTIVWNCSQKLCTAVVSDVVDCNSNTQNAFWGRTTILLLCQQLLAEWPSIQLCHFERMLRLLSSSSNDVSLISVCHLVLLKLETYLKLLRSFMFVFIHVWPT